MEPLIGAFGAASAFAVLNSLVKFATFGAHLRHVLPHDLRGKPFSTFPDHAL